MQYCNEMVYEFLHPKRGRTEAKFLDVGDPEFALKTEL